MPNAPRTSLATMTVEVDEKAKQFQERLELYTAIDHNPNSSFSSGQFE